MPVVYTASAIPAKPIWFPAKAPAASLSYALDLTETLRPGEYIHSIEASIAPSGDGELSATSLSVSGSVIEISLESGQPSRVYTIRYIVSVFGESIYEVIVNQGVTPVLLTDQAPVAPDPFFGTPITYTYVPDLDFTSVLNSGYLPLMMGI